MGSTVDLAGGWVSFWGRLTSAANVTELFQLLTWAGVALVAYSIAKWGWSKRRGQAQASLLGWPLFLGAAFAAPNAIFPAVLWLVDLVANAAVSLAH